MLQFLLTPLREGRLLSLLIGLIFCIFLLTPLREGRLGSEPKAGRSIHFYSRPCGRGDGNFPQVRHEVLRQIAER